MSVVDNGYKLWIVHLPKSQKHFGFNRVGKIVAGMFVQSIACCSPENGRISYRLSAPFLSYTGHVQDMEEQQSRKQYVITRESYTWSRNVQQNKICSFVRSLAQV